MTTQPEFRWCNECKQDLPITAFIPPRGAGLPIYHVCINCRRDQHRRKLFMKRALESGQFPIPPCCECCKRPFTKILVAYFDHDHTTDTFRGWICFHCNLALGHMRDDVNTLRRAIEYLESHQQRIKDQATLLRLSGADEIQINMLKQFEELRKKQRG